MTSAAQLALAQEAGRCVAATAAVVLAELAALREPDAPSPPHFDFLMLDATRPIEGELPGKYSAHLVCQMWRDGAPWLVRGPADAGAVARRLSERLIEEGHKHAAALIDLAVYGDRRAFRLLGSTKLMDARSRPLQQLDGGGAPLSAADVLASLVAPAIQPPTLPPAAIPNARRASGRACGRHQHCRGLRRCKGAKVRWHAKAETDEQLLTADGGRGTPKCRCSIRRGCRTVPSPAASLASRTRCLRP